MKRLNFSHLTRFLITCSLFLQFSPQCNGQNQEKIKEGLIFGTVYNELTYNPLIGVEVTADTFKVQSNRKGDFRLTNLPLHSVEMTVSKEGYQPYQAKMRLDSTHFFKPVIYLQPIDPLKEMFAEDALVKPALRLPQKAISAEEQFYVGFTAPKGFDHEAWVGLVEGAEPVEAHQHKRVMSYRFLKKKVSGDLLLKAPSKAGSYYIKMYNRAEDGLEILSKGILVE